jgi:hypothetical protein
MSLKSKSPTSSSSGMPSEMVMNTTALPLAEVRGLPFSSVYTPGALA